MVKIKNRSSFFSALADLFSITELMMNFAEQMFFFEINYAMIMERLLT